MNHYEPTAKKRATSRAREVLKDAADAQKAPTVYLRRPDTMFCVKCEREEVLFYCRACGHGTCLTASMTRPINVIKRNSLYLDSTIPDADIPAPLGESEREDITAAIDFATPLAPESEG